MESSLRRTFSLQNWNAFEILWAVVFIAAGSMVSLFSKDSLLNYVILVAGILCVVLAAKGNIWNYFFGIINSLGYAYVSYVNGLYGDMGLNVLFFVPTGIVGFFMWKRHAAGGTVVMRSLKSAHQGCVGVICLVSIVILGGCLSLIKTQNTPYIDATATVLSIVATLLMMWRYKEQWMLYIALNIVTIVMWAIRILNGSSDGTIMIVMWSAFLVNSVYGYINWHKGSMRKNDAGFVS
ncbi:MAG TPA: nicotinamide riboside transporter PnuC [Pseudomonadales bacterium]|nr:nicotinamide riboside transporter PnuC [Pseudomonadales bacterium]